ncbi:L-threonylcarbamoyladenylate synthase [Thalassotalea piscium]|uniref:Threonylcarbamoyl-AMP synthase n=1 Tax=Thalassotalea piscium TaxID=1230533 RepID=A0A7X0NHN1_9GAMM|nr:L-threonylcarbamoyladenylate synthase [Thalassotalea piscium]MBB6543548.1 L-threonylcarbamoyladenylate synthase [Thalassotalea piscium]
MALTAVDFFIKGGIIAYPTEAVFGLGCDPDNIDAIEKLLAIKNRSAEKGLILLAANYSQLLPFIDDEKIPQDKRSTILSRWPDGITQVLPKNKNCHALLTGKFDTIAVRITSQPDVVALCNRVNKPIVSTSANLSGEEPAKTWQALSTHLVDKIDYIIKGQTLGYNQPSTIIDALTGEQFRA